MEPVKRKNFKIGNYEYDSRINYYWFKNIDRYFHIISHNLKRFTKILYDYDKIIKEYDYKIFNYKVYKRDKNIEIKKIFIKLKNIERFLIKNHFKRLEDNNIKLYFSKKENYIDYDFNIYDIVNDTIKIKKNRIVVHESVYRFITDLFYLQIFMNFTIILFQKMIIIINL